MNNLEKWLLSIPKKDIIEYIQKNGCSECPAAEYCEKSKLRCCKRILAAWAKEIAK